MLRCSTGRRYIIITNETTIKNLNPRFPQDAERIELIKACRMDAGRGEYGGPFRPEVLLTTKEMLVKHKDVFAQVVFGLCLFDEVHVFKNPKTSSSKAAHAVNALVKIGLSG